MTTSTQKGFTLVELLVAISIIAVLASIAIASFTGAQKTARDADRKNDLRIVRDALEQYKLDQSTGYYPASTSSTPSVSQFTTVLTTLTSGTNPYVKGTISDPRNSSPYQYMYATNATPSATSFTLRACLENTNDAGENTSAPVSPCTTRTYTVTNI
jgi:type II secretion system protein G